MSVISKVKQNIRDYLTTKYDALYLEELEHQVNLYDDWVWEKNNSNPDSREELVMDLGKEEEVKRQNSAGKLTKKHEEPLPVVDYFREMELKMQSHLGRVVKIQGSGRKKSVTLFYEDNEDLEALLTDVCGKEFMKELSSL